MTINSQGLEKAWRFDIQHGPDGEANYAWVYNGKDLVATMRTHHAASVVEAMNRRVLPPVDGLEVVAWVDAGTIDLPWEKKIVATNPEYVQRNGGLGQFQPLVTLSQAASVIAGLKEANEALMRERTNLIETRREQIERLTKERNEAADRAKVWEHYWSQEVKVKSEVVSWVKEAMDKADAAEARVKELEEGALLLLSEIDAPNGIDWIIRASQRLRAALKGGSNG